MVYSKWNQTRTRHLKILQPFSITKIKIQLVSILSSSSFIVPHTFSTRKSFHRKLKTRINQMIHDPPFILLIPLFSRVICWIYNTCVRTQNNILCFTLKKKIEKKKCHEKKWQHGASCTNSFLNLAKKTHTHTHTHTKQKDLTIYYIFNKKIQKKNQFIFSMLLLCTNT
jgi:hypothetical protein